jgi:Leucine-rich repeat (LRR) protein
MTSDTPDKPKPRRRRLRFGLRTLVVFITLLCVGLAWLAWMWESAKEQRRVIAWVESKGGRMSFKDGRSDNWLQRSFVDGIIGSVDLSGTRVGDLSPLAGLEELKYIDLYDTPVSDVSPLAGLEKLEDLFLSNTSVTDVSPLEGLKGLGWLDLAGTPVSDVSPLAGLEGLTILGLSNTSVTDVSPLMGLEHLKILKLTNTQVSKDDVDRLQQALPDCEIIYQQPSSPPASETPDPTPGP